MDEHQEAELNIAPSIYLLSVCIGIVGLLLVIALLNQERDLALLSLLVLGLAAGAKVWSWCSLRNIAYGLEVERYKVFPGESFGVRAYVKNRKLLPVWLTLYTPAGTLTQERPNKGLTAASSLLWYQEARFSWQLVPRRRGVYPIGPLRINAGDLFGFFPQESQTGAMTEVLVYPRIVPLRIFTLKKRDFFGNAGARSPVDDPVYILGTNDYRNGRPAKYIHWKASARHNRLQEKIFDSTEHKKVLLVVDVKGFEEEGDEEGFERSLEVAASLAVRLDHDGCAQGFVTNGRIKGPGVPVIPMAGNAMQTSRILEALARLRMETDGDVLSVLRRGLVLPWGVTCLCFVHSGNADAALLRHYFNHRRTPAVFFTCQPAFGAEIERFSDNGPVYGIEDIRAGEGGEK